MPLTSLAAGTGTAVLAVPETMMGETYRLEAEEESCDAVHQMRDALELQLLLSGRKDLRARATPPPQQGARTEDARKPAVQRSRRT